VQNSILVFSIELLALVGRSILAKAFPSRCAVFLLQRTVPQHGRQQRTKDELKKHHKSKKPSLPVFIR
jgi:hypothetical protein